MKKHYFLFLVFGSLLLTASKCNNHAGPSAEEQQACLQQCNADRERIEAQYDQCVNNAITAHNTMIDRCIEGPPADRGECLRLARELLLRAIENCKATRDSAMRASFGCEGKCYLVDPGSTQ